jgi:hypothetical protein
MELLILLGANIQVLSNVLDITSHDDSHAFFEQRGNELRRLLMFKSFDLVCYLLALLLFRENESLATT